MKSKIRQKEIFKTLLFVLPYIAVEFTNTILVIIDKSLSNSIGKTAIIVFSSFVTLNWAINTIQACISQAHSIVLVRDREKHKVINTTGMFLELVTSSLIGILIFMFAKQITYIYTLEDDARTILTTILKLKAIQLPINSIAYIPKNKLKIDYKTKQIFIIMVIASTIRLYSLEFLATVVSCNYRAYLSANKDTKAIRNMALVGGICVRIPLALLVRHFNIGILGLSFVCGIDRSVRATYLRLYIRKNKENLA